MVAARFAQIKEEHDNLTRLETLFSALFVRAELDHSLVKAAQIRNRRHESIALKEKRHEVLKLISSLASGGNWTPAILSSDPTVRDQHHLPHSIKDVVDKYKDSQKFAPRMSSYLMTPMCSTLAGV
jgi:hypothetical protein